MFDGVHALLLDLDGVLYVEDEPLPGAREAVAELRARGLALRFVTNTTARPRRQILARLDRLGFEVPAGELATPSALAVRHCEERGHRSVALVMNEAVKADFAPLERIALSVMDSWLQSFMVDGKSGDEDERPVVVKLSNSVGSLELTLDHAGMATGDLGPRADGERRYSIYSERASLKVL